jgi:molybdate transport system substrate-binding protein
MLVAIAGLGMFYTLGASAAEIRILVANAVREPLLEVASAFEKETGHKVIAAFSGTAGVVKSVTSGEAMDIVLIGSDAIDQLVRDGKLVAEGRVDFAKSGIGIAVRPGIPKPDISTADAVRTALLNARSVAYSSGPSGVYVASLFKRLGVEEQVKPKLVLPPATVQIGDLLARGEVELGFQQVSDLLPIAGIQYVGPLPAAIQNTTIYRAAMHPGSNAADAARALLRKFASPEARPAVLKAGMEPG